MTGALIDILLFATDRARAAALTLAALVLLRLFASLAGS